MRLTLKSAVLTRLQDHKRGYTVEELYEDLGQHIGVILVMLESSRVKTASQCPMRAYGL